MMVGRFAIFTVPSLMTLGTVISIYENPFPAPSAVTIQDQQEALKVLRRNVLNTFSHVSREYSTLCDINPIMTLQIREMEGAGSSQATMKPGESPSLLFYYLFDDWITSYSLVAKREHKYGAALEVLRRNMFDRAKVDLMGSLHLIGRRLAVLKRIYQSYDLIITRVLERQRTLSDEARLRAEASSPSPANLGDAPSSRQEKRLHSMQQTSNMITTSAGEVSLGVPLSPPAIVCIVSEHIMKDTSARALAKFSSFAWTC